MFETAELGRKVSKQTFAEEEPKLHTALLVAQRAQRQSDFPVIVIVSGVEGAGKGEVVNLLHKWLDARGIHAHAFWEESDEERERPRYWRFWRALPRQGSIGVLFGSWYTQPIVAHVFGEIDEAAFERELARIVEFERLLIDDGALIVKLWFHLTEETQQKRLKADLGVKAASPQLKEYSKHYDRFIEVSERALRATDTGLSPWHIVEATNRRHRDLEAGGLLLGALEERLESGPRADAPDPPKMKGKKSNRTGQRSRSILDEVDLDRTITGKEYEARLDKHQTRLRRLAWKAKEQKRNTVLVFEGWDAGGKGGAIRRVTAAVDARLFHVISVAAPTDEERAHHYLWRFWRHIPRAGYMTIYDRSWYGRVLVERVEGFAREDEWRRAYREINDFEEQLVAHGVVLAKFWMHISKDEQLRRFEERKATPWKQHKITEEDWRNREKWPLYEEAVNDMVSHTSSAAAPWTIVPANDKRLARVEVVKTVADRLEEALE